MHKAVIMGVGPDRGLGAQLCKRGLQQGVPRPRWMLSLRTLREPEAKRRPLPRTRRPRRTWPRSSSMPVPM
jgi:hypothetical protein